jgi:argininosuccinate lyase
LADYLVERGVPFRLAHAAVGKAVRKAESQKVPLADLALETWQEIHPSFGEDLFQVFDPVRAVERRSAYGGTAPAAVAGQIKEAKSILYGEPVAVEAGELVSAEA